MHNNLTRFFHSLFTAFFALLYLNSFGQDTLSRYEIKVDSLFKHVKADEPGYIVGIIKDGQLIYKKGFGLANLEYKYPLNSHSAFYMGSTSKQFTAACLLYLASKGKLSIEDDIRKYLPEMPNYGKPITLSHLLHHNSGVREYTSMMLFSGHERQFEEVYGNDDVYQLLSNQTHLNFMPGEKHLYSSGGYILLAKVIERVTKTSLRQFADSVLFKPLGMTHTEFNDHHNEIIPNRVQSYFPVQNGYQQYLKVFDMVGDGGLITTLEDLAKWDQAFYTDKLDIKDFTTKMSQTASLNSGKHPDYAWGINAGKHHGLRTLEHGGFMLGYDSDILRFPDQRFTAIVLSNSRGHIWATHLTYWIADIFLSSYYQKTDIQLPKRVPAGNVTIKKAKLLEGYYWNASENYYNKITRSGDTLFYDNTDGWVSQLVPVAPDTFQLINTTIKLYFQNNRSMFFINPDAANTIQVFEKFDPTTPKNTKELERYVGDYFSAELHTNYKIRIRNNACFLQINSNPPIQIFPTTRNFVWNGANRVWIGFGEITFLSTPNNRVKGLSIGDQRVQGVYFEKK